MWQSLRARTASLRWPIKATALTAAYFVVAILGLRYATIGESMTHHGRTTWRAGFGTSSTSRSRPG